ncbi:DHHW family protein [Marinicrinis lubricantis]|uniref:DHHW family protein n=1 Tax=Marinicrinis lubricantis TaxID=2086470 RepID=A0ABW1IJL4_9BACL
MLKNGKWNVLLFLAPLYLLFILFLAGIGKSDVSDLEMRKLQERPVLTWDSLWSGQYFRDYENYVADHFVFREPFLKLSTFLGELRGGIGEEGVEIVYNNPGQQQAPAGGGEEQEPTESQLFDNYIVVGNKAVFLYYYTPLAAETYAETMNQFQAKLGKDIPVYSLIVPTLTDFIDNPDVRKLSPSQKEAIQYTYDHFNEGVTGIDAHALLNDHKDEYTYFRTDHHWISLGAYYAYEAFMNEREEQPVPLEDYESWSIIDFLGTTYNATLQPKLAENPDQITVYEPFVDYEYLREKNGKMLSGQVVDADYASDYGKFAVFLGGDSPWAEIETEVENGKSLLIVKDSYANPFIPFLLPHYQHIYIADMRYYEDDLIQFVRDSNVDEVLFLNSSSVTSHTGYTRLLIDKFGLDIPY